MQNWACFQLNEGNVQIVYFKLTRSVDANIRL